MSMIQNLYKLMREYERDTAKKPKTIFLRPSEYDALRHEAANSLIFQQHPGDEYKFCGCDIIVNYRIKEAEARG